MNMMNDGLSPFPFGSVPLSPSPQSPLFNSDTFNSFPPQSVSIPAPLPPAAAVAPLVVSVTTPTPFDNEAAQSLSLAPSGLKPSNGHLSPPDSLQTAIPTNYSISVQQGQQYPQQSILPAHEITTPSVATIIAATAAKIAPTVAAAAAAPAAPTRKRRIIDRAAAGSACAICHSHKTKCDGTLHKTFLLVLFSSFFSYMSYVSFLMVQVRGLAQGAFGIPMTISLPNSLLLSLLIVHSNGCDMGNRLQRPERCTDQGSGGPTHTTRLRGAAALAAAAVTKAMAAGVPVRALSNGAFISNNDVSATSSGMSSSMIYNEGQQSLQMGKEDANNWKRARVMEAAAHMYAIPAPGEPVVVDPSSIPMATILSSSSSSSSSLSSSLVSQFVPYAIGMENAAVECWHADAITINSNELSVTSPPSMQCHVSLSLLLTVIIIFILCIDQHRRQCRIFFKAL
jgi:hypothetical protein